MQACSSSGRVGVRDGRVLRVSIRICVLRSVLRAVVRLCDAISWLLFLRIPNSVKRT